MLTVHRIPGAWPDSTRNAWTLVELLVVIGIIGAFLGVAIPGVMRCRDASFRVNCASNLRQIACAVQQYADQSGQLPQGCFYPFPRTPRYRDNDIPMSWQTSILPFIEQNALWALAWKAQQEDPTDTHVPNLHGQVRRTVLPVFLCPAESRRIGGFIPEEKWALTTYMGVAGTSVDLKDGVFHVAFSVRFRDITDGTSNTLMVGERPAGPKGVDGAWYAGWGDTVCPLSQILPARRGLFEEGECPVTSFVPGTVQNRCDVAQFWSLHPGGANFALADGSVRFLSYKAASILPMLATRAGGEAVKVP